MDRLTAKDLRPLLLFWCIALGACGGGGGHNAPTAPPTATPPPTPAPTQAIEAAAGVATSTVVAVAAFVAEIPAAGAGGEARALSRDRPPSLPGALRNALLSAGAVPEHQRPGVGGGAARRSCPHGGTIDGTCSERRGSSTVSASLANCGLDEPSTGTIITATGGLKVTVAARGVCTTGVLPQGVMTTTRFTNLDGTVADPSGRLIERFTANLTETLDPTGEGCAGPNGNESFNGALRVAVPSTDVDLSLVARTLTFARTSSGAPCMQQLTANGGMDVDDRSGARQFSETLRGLGVTLTEREATGTVATLDGAMTNSCLGDIELQTITPLDFPGGSGCPGDGLLVLKRGDATNGRIWFTLAGLEFDFDADGTADLTVSSCADAAQCAD